MPDLRLNQQTFVQRIALLLGNGSAGEPTLPSF